MTSDAEVSSDEQRVRERIGFPTLGCANVRALVGAFFPSMEWGMVLGGKHVSGI